jgi:hypothetical protein
MDYYGDMFGGVGWLLMVDVTPTGWLPAKKQTNYKPEQLATNLASCCKVVESKLQTKQMTGVV